MRRRNFFIGLAGFTAAWPLAVRAQQPGRVYRLAVAHPATPVERLHGAGAPPRFYGAFFAELRRRGYVEGQNLIVEAYSGGGKPELFPALVERVVASKPDAIFTLGVLDPLFKSATTTIPIVVSAGDDVLVGGFITNFARPGGNITGVAVTAGPEIWGKRLALLLQAVPTAKRIAFLSTRAKWGAPDADQAAIAARNAAEHAGVSFVPALLDAATEPEYRSAFAGIARERPDALMLGDGAEHYGFSKLLAELTMNARLASLFPDRVFVDAGGMMSYGVDFPDLFRHAGDDIAQIFAGANPGDIPIYQPTRYELVINLKTARALGVTIPAMLQAGADDLIE